MNTLNILSDGLSGNHPIRGLIRRLSVQLVITSLAAMLAGVPPRRPGRNPAVLPDLRGTAFRRVWSVLGSYQAFDAEAIAWQVNRLDEYGCRWVMGADAEELRSVFFPRARGDQPGAWHSVDVMCPLHGRD